MNIKKFIIRIFMISVIGMLYLSCKKETMINNISSNPKSFDEVFESFWQGMNTNYVYWDIDTTNWDKAYTRYKPLFNQLDLNNKNDEQSAVKYFRTMTAGLIDGHYSLSFMPAKIADAVITPSLEQKKLHKDFHSPFLYAGIDSNYLDKGFISGTCISSNGTQTYAVSGIIKNKALYFYCNQFYLQEAYSTGLNNGVQTTMSYFFNLLKNMPLNIKEVIVDVRNNNGGELSDLNFFVGKLVNKPLPWGYTHYKSNNGRLSYTPWINATILPQAGNLSANLPVIVLADNYSISLAEAVTMAIHTLPKGKFIGESTWGATGPVTENEVYNDGSFIVPNFLSVFTSSAAFKYINGKRYEGIGFPPDINVPFNLNALWAGDDPALDSAISLVH